MDYTPDRNLSDSERLVVIETMLGSMVPAMVAQQAKLEDLKESTDKRIYKIKRALWVTAGVAFASATTSGAGWLSFLGQGG